MRAVVHERFGPPPEVLTVQDVPRPEPGPEDLLVRVEATAVAKGDFYVASGYPYIARPAFGIRRPKQRIAGLEFSGVVETVGPDVDDFAVGDEVFGWVDGGALAEYVVASRKHVAAKPPSITFEQAAAIPMSGLTAYEAVEAAGVEEGTRVLVTGASGGVGSFAVQIATSLGAEVTGVASGRNRDFVLGLGADRFIDYTNEGISDDGAQYDVIIDIAGSRSLPELRRAMVKKGVAVIVGGSGGKITMGYGRTLRALALSPFVPQRFKGLISKPSRENLEALSALVDAGDLTPHVEATYPLERAGEAVQLVGAGRSTGKTVVTL
jgi:NADPH:quinone reductase-like Zn-dependent oxidoreductase